MNFFKPTYFLDTVTDIDFDFLKKAEIKNLLIDIDDTLTVHDEAEINTQYRKWIDYMKSKNIKMVLVSNNFKNRVEKFAKKIKLPYVHFSLKPLPYGIKKSLESHMLSKDRTALIGDQIFTDILAANICGIKSILVNPLSEGKGKFLKVKRWAEKPLRKKFEKTIKPITKKLI